MEEVTGPHKVHKIFMCSSDVQFDLSSFCCNCVTLLILNSCFLIFQCKAVQNVLFLASQTPYCRYICGPETEIFLIVDARISMPKSAGQSCRINWYYPPFPSWHLFKYNLNQTNFHGGRLTHLEHCNFPPRKFNFVLLII